MLDADGDRWWSSHPRETYQVFSIDIESAAFVGWDVARGELTVRGWSVQAGATEARRSYP